MNKQQREIIAYRYNQLCYESGAIEEGFQICKDLIRELRETDAKLDTELAEIDKENIKCLE
jgi:hypothetical protein